MNLVSYEIFEQSQERIPIKHKEHAEKYEIWCKKIWNIVQTNMKYSAEKNICLTEENVLLCKEIVQKKN